MAGRAKATEAAAEAKSGKTRKSRSTTPTRESLAALSQERLIGLILEEVGQSAAFKKRLSAALAAALHGSHRHPSCRYPCTVPWACFTRGWVQSRTGRSAALTA